MKRIVKQTTALGFAALLSACGQLATMNDGATRLSLAELAAADTSTSTSGSSATCDARDQRPAPPDFSACSADLTTYCASTPLPAEPGPGGREQVKAAVDCLKTNIASVSAACQTVVNNLPPPPPEGGPGGGDHRPPPPPPLKLDACTADLTTYCASTPLPTEPGPGGREKVKAAVDCLKTNLSSLSAECQTEVNDLPPPPPDPGSSACAGSLDQCSAEANTNCSALLPTQAEVASMTSDQIHAKVQAVLSCLAQEVRNLSSGCQTALDAQPKS